MTPEQFIAGAIKVYGRKKWKPKLAADLGVDVSTIYRLMKREQIPGPYEVALAGMLEHRKREIELEKAARRLLPRKIRRKKNAAQADRHARTRHPQPGPDRPDEEANS